MEDFIVPILFWFFALCWGLKTCWDQQSWQPLKDGVGIFLVLFLLPALLILGVWSINEFFDGGLKTAFGWFLAICVVGTVYFGVRDTITDWLERRNN
jgi:hypothetical protein